MDDFDRGGKLCLQFLVENGSDMLTKSPSDSAQFSFFDIINQLMILTPYSP
ncbi:hypothetical protein [Oceanospirillum beijerinckii]|uniref:hypothetical protein n=1 Tax=Oceanospirillum beijerinckii TaxID=64976 RepID=UPI000416D27E|nr:hypothetical protein [Oceanospirillum beijerinckii]